MFCLAMPFATRSWERLRTTEGCALPWTRPASITAGNNDATFTALVCIALLLDLHGCHIGHLPVSDEVDARLSGSCQASRNRNVHLVETGILALRTGKKHLDRLAGDESLDAFGAANSGSIERNVQRIGRIADRERRRETTQRNAALAREDYERRARTGGIDLERSCGGN